MKSRFGKADCILFLHCLFLGFGYYSKSKQKGLKSVLVNLIVKKILGWQPNTMKRQAYMANKEFSFLKFLCYYIIIGTNEKY